MQKCLLCDTYFFTLGHWAIKSNYLFTIVFFYCFLFIFPLPSFRIHYQPLVVTTSCLDVASKNKLKNVIHKLGGHLVSEWQPSCTHLVMSLVKVTIKVLAFYLNFTVLFFK